jgi:hypothetical protein
MFRTVLAGALPQKSQAPEQDYMLEAKVCCLN